MLDRHLFLLRWSEAVDMALAAKHMSITDLAKEIVWVHKGRIPCQSEFNVLIRQKERMVHGLVKIWRSQERERYWVIFPTLDMLVVSKVLGIDWAAINDEAYEAAKF